MKYLARLLNGVLNTYYGGVKAKMAVDMGIPYTDFRQMYDHVMSDASSYHTPESILRLCIEHEYPMQEILMLSEGVDCQLEQRRRQVCPHYDHIEKWLDEEPTKVTLQRLDHHWLRTYRKFSKLKKEQHHAITKLTCELGDDDIDCICGDEDEVMQCPVVIYLTTIKKVENLITSRLK